MHTVCDPPAGMLAGVGSAACRKTPGPTGSELVPNACNADSGVRSRARPAFAPLTRGSNRCLFWCSCLGWESSRLCVSWPPLGRLPGFPRPSNATGYAGLGASVHQSGETNRGGRITKEGRSDLRGVMVEAAWVAVEHHPHWKAQFERLAARIGKQKAIVAVARKLLVAS